MSIEQDMYFTNMRESLTYRIKYYFNKAEKATKPNHVKWWMLKADECLLDLRILDNQHKH